jgi:hypothetical protein
MTQEQAKAAKAYVNATFALSEAIRKLGKVPSGELYSQVMNSLDLRTYESIIDVLKGAGVVSESGHLLTWTGPTIAA